LTVLKLVQPLDFSGYETIPKTTRSALQQYVQRGVMPGSFLCAVLSNDLMGAVAYADNENMRNLRDIAMFVYNEVPSSAWGDKNKIRQWIQQDF
jgi:hypothetical protein